MKSIYILCLTLLALTCPALDRFAVLARVESATKAHPEGNDAAVGASGEVSRYQIMPSVWAEETRNVVVYPLGHPDQLRKQSPTNAMDALEVAILIQSHRTESFERLHKRQPTDAEFYLLWHRPATVLGGRKPTAKEMERAQRFANLCARQ